MKARALAKAINVDGYYVHDNGGSICIGGALVSDLIALDKKTLKLRYIWDTPIRNAKLESIWLALERLVSSGEIQYFIEGNDEIENPLRVYTFKNDGTIIASHTDAYGWPNTDYTGRIMHDNLWFKTRDDAVEAVIDRLMRLQGQFEEMIERNTAELLKIRKDAEKNDEALQRALRERRAEHGGV